MTTPRHPVHLAGSALTPGRGHVCAFFHGREEQYRVILPFLQEGFERGDKLIHITDPEYRADHVRRLESAGIGGNGGCPPRQVEVLSWQEVYLRDGHFDQHAMLTLVEEVLTASKQQGFRTTRLTANMEWAMQDLPGVEHLVEYEARANYVLPKYDAAVV
jgi:hypothetical protein